MPCNYRIKRDESSHVEEYVIRGPFDATGVEAPLGRISKNHDQWLWHLEIFRDCRWMRTASSEQACADALAAAIAVYGPMAGISKEQTQKIAA